MNLRDKLRYKFLQMNYKPKSAKGKRLDTKLLDEIEDLLDNKNKGKKEDKEA